MSQRGLTTIPIAWVSVFRRHREDLLIRAGAVIVISGNKNDGSGLPIPSPGVIEEVQLAQTMGKIVIPIGVTGYVAKQIWDDAMVSPEKYLPGVEIGSDLAALGDLNWTMDSVIDAIANLLNKAEIVAAGKAASK